MKLLKSALISPVIIFVYGRKVHAFAPSTRTNSARGQLANDANSNTSLHAHEDLNTASRRQLLRNAIGTIGAAYVLGSGENAEASYSAYTNREKDWEDRQKKGGK